MDTINSSSNSIGSVRVMSPAEIEKERITAAMEQNERSRNLEEALTETQQSMLSAHIETAWENNKRAKFKIVDRLINCMQLRKGKYDAKTLQAIRSMGGSEVFIKLTATKCRGAGAWVKDVILPANDKAWAISPTPIADIPEDKEAELNKAAEEAVAFEFKSEIERLQSEGQEITPELNAQMNEMADLKLKQLKRELADEVQKEAHKGAAKMETKIEDQNAEGGWTTAIEEFIDDFVTFPSAILKGPIMRKRKTLGWEGSEIKVQEEIVPTWERVSPFDYYPSSDAAETNEGDAIEHIRFRRGDLYAMIGVDGYNEEQIRSVLDEYGRSGLKQWMFEESERRVLEDKNILDNNDLLIDGLHFWGYVQGKMLLDWGYDESEITDPLAEYQIDAIKIGRYVIRAKINSDPLGRVPYHKASFQRVQGSFWGDSVPELMEDIQRICNAAVRALSNNMGMASGPMVGLNMSRIVGGALPEIRPWQQFQFKNDSAGMAAGGRGEPPVHFFQPKSNAGELLKVYKEFEAMADDATNIPRYMYGNEKIGGAGSTMGGLSMLMDAASKGIKSAIRHVDRYVLRPAIEMLWYHNMIENDDEEIKGDCKVVAAGVNGIIARDQQQASRLELLDRTANPLDMEIVKKEGRRTMLEKVFEHAGMDNIIPAKEDFDTEQANKSKQKSTDDLIKEAQLKKADAEAEMALLEVERLQLELNSLSQNTGVPTNAG